MSSLTSSPLHFANTGSRKTKTLQIVLVGRSSVDEAVHHTYQCGAREGVPKRLNHKVMWAVGSPKSNPPSRTSAQHLGMDVHKEAISIAVMNGTGKLLMESIIETKAIGGQREWLFQP